MKKRNVLIGFVSVMVAVVGLASCGKNKKKETSKDKLEIVTIEKLSSRDNVDEYKVVYSNGSIGKFQVTNEIDGANPVFQTANGYLQFKYNSKSEWSNIVPLDYLKGDMGDQIELNVDATSINWKYKNDSNWNELIKLDNISESNGKEVVIDICNGYISWKYDGDTSWTNLISIAELTGNNGKEIELQNDGTNILWKYTVDSSWNTLISVDSLKGVNGKEVVIDINEGYISWKYSGDELWTRLVSVESLIGDSGEEVELQNDGTNILWKYTNDSAWTTLIPISSLKGSNGKSAYEIYKENYDYQGIEIQWLRDLIDGNLLEKPMHTVTFMTDDVIYDETQVKEGKNAIKPQNPTKEGYTFVGWFDENDDYWVFNGYDIHKDITLYAKWEYNHSIINLNLDGGVSNIDTIKCEYGNVVNLPIPSKMGYTFVGWYDGDSIVESGIWNRNDNVNLVAHWEAKEYQITLVSNDGILDNVSDITTVQFGSNFTLPVCISNDIDLPFSGWFTGNDVQITNLNGESFDKYLIDGNITLYAKYFNGIYTVDDLNNIKNNLSGKYMLMNDIDLDGVAFTPIGTEANPFNGELNGNGKTIKNLMTLAPVSASKVHYGLFGFISNATIKDLNIDSFYYVLGSQELSSTIIYCGVLAAVSNNSELYNIKVSNSNISTVSTSYQGGIIGQATGGIGFNNCETSSNMLISNNVASRTGGYVGDATGAAIINDSISNGNINSYAQYIGGFIGYAKSLEINNSCNKTNIINNSSSTGGLGGIAGHSGSSTLYKTSNIGNITDDTMSNQRYVGGFIGETSLKTYEFNACYNSGTIIGAHSAGFIGSVGKFSASETNYSVATCNFNNCYNDSDTVYAFTWEDSVYSRYDNMYYAYRFGKINILNSYSTYHTASNYIGGNIIQQHYVYETRGGAHYYYYYSSTATNCVDYIEIDKDLLTKEYFVQELGWSTLIWDFSDDSLGYVVPKLKD